MRRYYGLDLRTAEASGVPADYVADLASALPPDCATARAEDPDAAWSRTDLLLAMLINTVTDAAWGMSGAKGAPPHVGPRWMREASRKRLGTRHMRAADMEAQLARFARAAEEGRVTLGQQ